VPGDRTVRPARLRTRSGDASPMERAAERRRRRADLDAPRARLVQPLSAPSTSTPDVPSLRLQVGLGAVGAVPRSPHLRASDGSEESSGGPAPGAPEPDEGRAIARFRAFSRRLTSLPLFLRAASTRCSRASRPAPDATRTTCSICASGASTCSG
jgi:hypothetical protein